MAAAMFFLGVDVRALPRPWRFCALGGWDRGEAEPGKTFSDREGKGSSSQEEKRLLGVRAMTVSQRERKKRKR